MEISPWPELLVVYGPFVLSLLMLAPKGEWIPSLKLREILTGNPALFDEVVLTFDLVGRFEKLIEVAGFDIVLTYLNLLACLADGRDRSGSEIIGAVAVVLLYHAVLAVLGRVIYNDLHFMGYPHLNQRYKVLLRQPIKGGLYLFVLTSGLVLLAMLCTAGTRLTLLGRI